MDKKKSELEAIPLAALEPHPLNSNLMSAELREKLAANIRDSGRYPPLIVRRFKGEHYQILDGHQRAAVLSDLGETSAWCCVWPCTDEEALMLLATLNRLEGQDVPGRRAALIAELEAHHPLAELARLLPESEAELEATRSLFDLDVDALIADLSATTEATLAEMPVAFTFAVNAADAPEVEEAITVAIMSLSGKNRRGQALVAMARACVDQNGERGA